MSETSTLIGRRLRELREARGWTLRELAIACQKEAGTLPPFTETLLSRWERGPAEPRASDLAILARGFGVDVADLARAAAA